MGRKPGIFSRKASKCPKSINLQDTEVPVTHIFNAKFQGRINVCAPEGNSICEAAVSLICARSLQHKSEKERVSIHIVADDVMTLQRKEKTMMFNFKLSDMTFVWSDPIEDGHFGLIIKEPSLANQHIFYYYKMKPTAKQFISAMKLVYYNWKTGKTAEKEPTNETIDRPLSTIPIQNELIEIDSTLEIPQSAPAMIKIRGPFENMNTPAEINQQQTLIGNEQPTTMAWQSFDTPSDGEHMRVDSQQTGNPFRMGSNIAQPLDNQMLLQNASFHPHSNVYSNHNSSTVPTSMNWIRPCQNSRPVPTSMSFDQNPWNDPTSQFSNPTNVYWMPCTTGYGGPCPPTHNANRPTFQNPPLSSFPVSFGPYQ